jgi:hypothetical protein
MGCGASHIDTLQDENVSGPDRLQPVGQWDVVPGAGPLVASVPLVAEDYVTLTQEAVSFGRKGAAKVRDSYKVMDSAGKTLLEIPHRDPTMLGEARRIDKLDEKDWPRSYKPIPVRDGDGTIVAALVSTNDPGECTHHFSDQQKGDAPRPEAEPWYYKVLGARPRWEGQAPLLHLEGTALYQWTRQEFTGANLQDPSARVHFATPALTTEVDTFGAPQDSSGCFYAPRKAPSFSLKSQVTLDSDVLNFVGKNLVAGVRAAKPCFRTKRGVKGDGDLLTVWVGKGADPALLICAAWAFDLAKEKGRTLPPHLLPWAFAGTKTSKKSSGNGSSASTADTDI